MSNKLYRADDFSKDEFKVEFINNIDIGDNFKCITHEFILIESVCMADHNLILRTWKERLFSLPWNPFRKFKYKKVPWEKVIIIGNLMYAHPVICQRIKKFCKYHGDNHLEQLLKDAMDVTEKE